MKQDTLCAIPINSEKWLTFKNASKTLTKMEKMDSQ